MLKTHQYCRFCGFWFEQSNFFIGKIERRNLVISKEALLSSEVLLSHMTRLMQHSFNTSTSTHGYLGVKCCVRNSRYCRHSLCFYDSSRYLSNKWSSIERVSSPHLEEWQAFQRSVSEEMKLMFALVPSSGHKKTKILCNINDANFIVIIFCGSGSGMGLTFAFKGHLIATVSGGRTPPIWRKSLRNKKLLMTGNNKDPRQHRTLGSESQT